MESKKVLGVREVQSNHCLNQSRACPTRRVKKRLGSGKSKAIFGSAVWQPTTEGLQDVEFLQDDA